MTYLGIYDLLCDINEANVKMSSPAQFTCTVITGMRYLKMVEKIG